MTELHEEIFEASELGWKARYHPMSIIILGSIYILTKTELDPDGDVISWTYTREEGTAKITILND